MTKKQDKSVTHRAKSDKRDISEEPEMIELQRMIRDGELDKDRAVEYIEKELTGEEMGHVDNLLTILRSDDAKSKQALLIMINQIIKGLDN